MIADRNIDHEWAFLIGYTWAEAKGLLEEAGVDYEPRLTTAPNKKPVCEDARVVALRLGPPLIVICSAEDWTIE